MRALIGRGIDRQLQRVGCTPSPRANLVLWHMHVPLPWHMHLCLRMIDRCRVTRPEQPTATRRFFPLPRTRRSARVATCCGFLPKRNPTILLSQLSVHRTQLLATYLDDDFKSSRLGQLVFLNTATSQGNLSIVSPHHMHASRRAIPVFPTTAFWALTTSRI